MTLSERAFQIILRLYPPSLRRSHGTEMLQFARASLAARGRAAWLPLLADAARSIPREWLRTMRRRPAHPALDHARPVRREPIRDVFRDVRYGVRLLLRSPGFTAAAVLTLALGIGANTAVVSLVGATLLSPVHVREPERLVVWSWTSSYPDYQEYTKRTDIFDGVAAVGSAGRVNIVVDGAAELVPAVFLSGNALDVFDVAARHGRPLLPADDVPNGPVVAVLGHDYWRGRFGSDPSVVGRGIRVNGRPVTIVGVLEKNFRGLSLSSNPSIYMPAAAFGQMQTGFFARANPLTARGFVWLNVVGRLRPGVSPEQAASAMTALYARLHPPSPGRTTERLKLETLPVRALGRRFADVRSFVMTLAGSSALTLLIACANLANLLLVRAAARRREIGARLALGATRGRVVRQVLAETLVLAVAGGLAGVLVAAGAFEALSTFELPGGIAIGNLGLEIDARVLAVAFGLSLVTGLLFGAAPAWRASTVDPLLSLRGESRTATSGSRLRGTLIGAQVALSLVLLAGTALFVRSLASALDIPLGFDPRGVVTASVNAGLARYDDGRARALYADALARLRVLPQIESAAWASMIPTRATWVNQTAIEAYLPQAGEDVTVNMAHVGAGYFRTIGARVVTGREFTPADSAATLRVAVVNQAMAKKYWAGRDAIGGRFEQEGAWVTVVGIVENAVGRDLREPPVPFAYLAFDQWLAGKGSIATDSAHLFVRSSRRAADAASLVREQLRTLDAELPVYDILPLEDRVAPLVMPQRMGALLFGAFSALALALATIGIYGVASYAAALRTREIGIRVALGAGRQEIRRLVLAQALLPVTAGVAIGLALALWASTLARAFLYDVSPRDPIAFATVAAFLIAVSLVAGYLPARRAARVDPLTALRHE